MTETWTDLTIAKPLIEKLLVRYGEHVGGQSSGWGDEEVVMLFTAPTFSIRGTIVIQRAQCESRLRWSPVGLGDIEIKTQLANPVLSQTTRNPKRIPDWIFQTIQQKLVLDLLADL